MQMITEVDVIVMFPPQIFIAFYRNMEYNGEVVVRFVVPSGVTAQQTFQIKRVTMMLSVSAKGMVIWFFYPARNRNNRSMGG